ncbi:MAG: hypothetical protein K8T91_05395 [Planctomycetes bacterium]|nr:hypothetical protein [Planctomycetota bacterium]
MKPLKVSPLKKNYNPRYPSFVEVEDWEVLIRETNQSLFGPSTLLFAGILGGSLFVSGAQAEEPAKPPVGPPLTSSIPKAAEIANAALEETAASGHWFANSKTREENVVDGNPAVIVPVIRISFGNSYVGVFDTVRAKQATIKMFEAYGVQLQPNHQFKRDGIKFEAGGYDPKKNIGFEILGSDQPPGALNEPPPKPEAEADKLLDPKETAALKEAVAKRRELLFLAPVQQYPNMDGDQYTPLRAYLQSVIDYLEWLKQQGRL